MDTIIQRNLDDLNPISLAELTTAEQFVVGTSRCWDVFCDGPDPTLAWRELYPVFIYMDALNAMCAFDAVFRVLAADGRRLLRFDAVDSPTVGVSEARLLGGIAALQRGHVHSAGVTLACVLSRTHIHALLPPLARIAAVLDAAGHRLPDWRKAPEGRFIARHAAEPRMPEQCMDTVNSVDEEIG